MSRYTVPVCLIIGLGVGLPSGIAFDRYLLGGTPAPAHAESRPEWPVAPQPRAYASQLA